MHVNSGKKSGVKMFCSPLSLAPQSIRTVDVVDEGQGEGGGKRQRIWDDEGQWTSVSHGLLCVHT